MQSLLTWEQQSAQRTRAYGRSTFATLLGLVAIALVVRLAYFAAVAHGIVIDNDGSEYARAAENIRHGIGLVGMRGGPLEVFPPLYSYAIAALWPIVGNGELAGRLISLVAGIALPVAVFFVTKQLFGRAAAVVAGLVTAFNPFLVDLSIAVLTDQSYVTLIVAGLGLAMRAQRRHAAIDAALSGVCFGLAYLLRPEALLEGIALAVTLFVLVLRRSGIRRALAVGGASLACLVIVSAPYLVSISRQARGFAFEEKSAINYYIGTGLLAGQSYERAALSIGDDLRSYGRELNDAIELPKPSLGRRIAFALAVAPHQAFNILVMFKGRQGLTPLGIALLLVGAVRSLRGRSRAELQVIAGVLVAVLFAALVSVMQFWGRYGAPFLVLAMPWVGKGAVDLYAFAARTLGGLRSVSATRLGMGALAVVLVAWSVVGTREEVSAARFGQPVQKTAGLWLRTHDATPGAVMTSSMIVPYYAGAVMIALPYTLSPDVAIRYIERQDPRYVALVEGPANAPSLPYLSAWITRGLPSPHARLVFSSEASDGSVVKLYRWDEHVAKPHR